MSSSLVITCSMSSSYGITFWGYRKGSRANSNYEFVGIKRIKCYFPWKIHLRYNNVQAVRWMLQVLKKNKLFLHLEKCEFYKWRIEYLGLVISENEVSIDLVKVAGVQEWPTLENKTDVQAFLGFMNFYRRFIQDFSAKAWPLFDLICSEIGRASCRERVLASV